MTEKLRELFHCMWRKKAILQVSRIHPYSTYTKGKEILTSATTTGASLYCQLLEIY